jgi:ADP-ribosyl-[dinitrogen reductase] hydrolase
MNTPHQRLLGSLYGSLIGDALGVPVEFRSREDRVKDPVTGMRDYGTHGQPAGTWSDDGALLLCSVESLVEKGFDPQDMGERFVQWLNQGLWSAHGMLFDIGIATRKALLLIEHGCPAELSGGTGQYDNGNGSLMRILPVILASLKESPETMTEKVFRVSSLTHGHERSKLACAFYGLLMRHLIAGSTAQEALNLARPIFAQAHPDSPELGCFRDLLNADLASWPVEHIRSGGYVMETLTASIWCLLTTSSFSECVLKAVNLGDDTDTTGCVAGGLAGALYGLDSIPTDWLTTLPRQKELRDLFERFIQTC